MQLFTKPTSPLWLGLACFLCQFTVQAQHSPDVKRIVTAGGSVTEIVYALNAQESLVAVDTSSLYPAAALKLPKIGYYRQLNTEGILSMAPTHVIAAAQTL